MADFTLCNVFVAGILMCAGVPTGDVFIRTGKALEWRGRLGNIHIYISSIRNGTDLL